MPVRSFSSITLEKLLYLEKSREIVWPFIKELLVIYMKLINECDHETLIGTL